MRRPEAPHQQERENGHQPHRVHLPGFIREDVGLGDAIKRVTSTIGIRPCGGCLRRAEVLNRWVVFTGWRSI